MIQAEKDWLAFHAVATRHTERELELFVISDYLSNTKKLNLRKCLQLGRKFHYFNKFGHAKAAYSGEGSSLSRPPVIPAMQPPQQNPAQLLKCTSKVIDDKPSVASITQITQVSESLITVADNVIKDISNMSNILDQLSLTSTLSCDDSNIGTLTSKITQVLNDASFPAMSRPGLPPTPPNTEDNQYQAASLRAKVTRSISSGDDYSVESLDPVSMASNSDGSPSESIRDFEDRARRGEFDKFCHQEKVTPKAPTQNKANRGLVTRQDSDIFQMSPLQQFADFDDDASLRGKKRKGDTPKYTGGYNNDSSDDSFATTSTNPFHTDESEFEEERKNIEAMEEKKADFPNNGAGLRAISFEIPL